VILPQVAMPFRMMGLRPTAFGSSSDALRNSGHRKQQGCNEEQFALVSTPHRGALLLDGNAVTRDAFL
jgi:hypothetical protein